MEGFAVLVNGANSERLSVNASKCFIVSPVQSEIPAHVGKCAAKEKAANSFSFSLDEFVKCWQLDSAATDFFRPRAPAPLYKRVADCHSFPIVMHKVRHILKQVPAIALLLLFVSGWLAVPLTLAAPEPIMCGMVCCEESGECCCFLSRQAHQHEDGDTDDDAQLVSMGKGCQSNCATPPSVSPLTLAQKNIHHTVRLALLAPGKQSLHQTTTPVSFELGRKSSPRAPPLFS